MEPIQVFSTCSAFRWPLAEENEKAAGSASRVRVTEVARWSEAVGCEGILVYTEDRLVDPCSRPNL
jgi:hypothetical protein